MKKLSILAFGLTISVAAVFAHSDAFKPTFVDTLVDPYLTIQKGLAGDDLVSSQAGAAAFLKAMEGAPHKGDAHEEAMDLIKPVKAISEAKEIKSARAEFLDLSRQMTALIEHVGVSSKEPLYTAFCPMAFDNKGGQWIQSGKTVANPYYGSMMLHCGSIKKQIAGSVDHSERSIEGMQKHNHSGHSH